MLISTISYNAIPLTTVVHLSLLLFSHLLHATVCIVKSFLYHDKTGYVISYHGILCHNMLYVTTITASLVAMQLENDSNI